MATAGDAAGESPCCWFGELVPYWRRCGGVIISSPGTTLALALCEGHVLWKPCRCAVATIRALRVAPAGFRMSATSPSLDGAGRRPRQCS